MAQYEVQSKATFIDQAIQDSAASYPKERRIRRITAWVTLVLLISGQLGAAWDREWHANVGRDQFWTPPHTLIYSSVAGAGLIALGMVLAATFRYRRHAKGVDDTSTISVFGYFHAPLGFVVSGFGALQALVAAPLDNYWHELYGIDIAMWAPFHMFGITGGLIGTLGMVYVFASEAAIQRQTETGYRRFLGFSALEWGALTVIAGIMNFTLIGYLQFPVITVGLLQLPTYLIPLTICSAFGFVAAIRFTNRPGAATATLFLLLLETLLSELFIPWAIRTAVAQQGLAYRIPNHIPYFRPAFAFLPLVFLFSALVVDGITLWRVRHGQKISGSIRNMWLTGMLMTIPEVVIAILMIVFAFDPAHILMDQVNSYIPAGTVWPVICLTIPVLLASGALSAILGADFGELWHWNTR